MVSRGKASIANVTSSLPAGKPPRGQWDDFFNSPGLSFPEREQPPHQQRESLDSAVSEQDRLAEG